MPRGVLKYGRRQALQVHDVPMMRNRQRETHNKKNKRQEDS